MAECYGRVGAEEHRLDALRLLVESDRAPDSALSFTHISLLTEVLTVINLAAIFNNTVHFFELSNELNENTITV